MPGSKQKLTITPCDLDDNKNPVLGSSSDAFEAMINPSGYSHTYAIQYTTAKVQGQSSAEAKFSAGAPEKIELEELVLDGTGVVGGLTGGILGAMDVKSQIELLKTVVYDYIGVKHEPPIVQVSWGSLIFFGRINALVVKYTLFKPSGEPLRARVKLTFTEYRSTKEISIADNRSSPDLTHIVEFKAGDSLPMLCHKIYKNSSYYIEVARVNNLTNFRDLQPGIKLRFPPLGNG